MQGNFLQTATFPEFTSLVQATFTLQKSLVRPAIAPIFIKEPIGKHQGNTKKFTEYDTSTFARRKREGANAAKASAGVGYSVIMEKKRIAIEIDITQEMRDENRVSEVNTKLTNLAHFCPQRIELDGTHLLTFCNATSYTDMDGETVTVSTGDSLPLVYAAHTCKYSSRTWRNRVSGDPVFSQGALEAAEQLAVTEVVNNFGERRVLRYNAIISGDDPNTCNRIKQVLESTGDIDAAHGSVLNVNRSKYRHIVLPWLASTATGARDSTKERWWFLAALGQGMDGWQAYYGEWEAPHLKEQPKPGANNDDYSADVWTHGARAGYGFRAATGRGLIGALPTS